MILLALVLFLALAAKPLKVSSSVASTCPDVVREAWSTTDEVCTGTGRNQACYGHIMLEAEPQTHVERFEFDQEGDIVSVVDLRSLRLSQMDLDSGAWGVALMQLQANIPDSLGDQNATLVLFGDVNIEDTFEVVPLVEMSVTSPHVINVRTLPTTEANIADTLAPEETVIANGRLADSSWVRVHAPNGQNGWVFAALLDGQDALDTLAVVEPGSVYYGPMQAFYFKSGMQDAICPEAPNSGILIQTPEGVGKITLLINEVDIQLGSTVFFQAQAGNQMAVRVVEGSAYVRANGIAWTATAGSEIVVPMGEDMRPSGPPSRPQPYDISMVGALPVDHLPREVVVHPPLTPQQINALINETISPAAGQDTNGDGLPGSDDGTDTDDDLPPGLVDNPGLDGALPPGHGGDTPPGLDDGGGDDGDGDTSGGSDLPPGLVDNPGLDGELPPGHGGAPPGQTRKDK